MTPADVRSITELAIETGKLKSHNDLLLAGCQEWKRLHAESAQTIAEQQREIARLKSWIRQHAQHPYSCSSDQSAERKCTCGLDEVLK